MPFDAFRRAALLAALALAPPAGAARLGSGGCAFVSVSGVDFGSYDEIASSPLVSTSTMIIRCTGVGNADALVAASAGMNGPSNRDRQMAGIGNGSVLRYQLYIDSSLTIVWGDGSNNTKPIVVHQNGANKDFTVYGLMPAGQDGEVGQYGDTITITVLP